MCNLVNSPPLYILFDLSIHLAVLFCIPIVFWNSKYVGEGSVKPTRQQTSFWFRFQCAQNHSGHLLILESKQMCQHFFSKWWLWVNMASFTSNHFSSKPPQTLRHFKGQMGEKAEWNIPTCTQVDIPTCAYLRSIYGSARARAHAHSRA